MGRPKSKMQRISPEFHELCKSRAKMFGTTMVEESKNMADLTNMLGTRLGFDPKNLPFKKYPSIKFNKKVLIFR